MYLEVPHYYTGNFSLGGFKIENVLIEYETDVPLLIIRGSRLSALGEVAKIQGDVTVSSSQPKNFEYIKYDPKANIDFDLHINYQFKSQSKQN